MTCMVRASRAWRARETRYDPAVILGDISTRLNESSALRDFVYECIAGREIGFVTGLPELDQKLLLETGHESSAHEAGKITRIV